MKITDKISTDFVFENKIMRPQVALAKFLATSYLQDLYHNYFQMPITIKL